MSTARRRTGKQRGAAGAACGSAGPAFIVAFLSAGCGGAELRGAELANAGERSTAVAEYENVGCVDRGGAPASLARLRILLEQRGKDWVLRVVRPDGVAFVVSNRWQHGDEHVFQAIVERSTESALLFDFRLRDVPRALSTAGALGSPERTAWAGRMAITDHFGESQDGDRFRAVIPDAPVACWLRAITPSPLGSGG